MSLEGYRDSTFDWAIIVALVEYAQTEGSEPGDELVDIVEENRVFTDETGIPPTPPKSFFWAFRRALYDVLCSNDAKAESNRKKIFKDANIGQSSVAMAIASLIAPTLGTSAGMIAGAVTVALAIIGRVGLSAWCATQSARD